MEVQVEGKRFCVPLMVKFGRQERLSLMENTKRMPHRPDSLPLDGFDVSSFAGLIGRANRAIARFDGKMQGLVNPNLLLTPMRDQEAVLSSKIEGTQATLKDVLEFDARFTDRNQAVRFDIQEIVNYRLALEAGRKDMESQPLTLNLIRKVHGILMRGVRGGHADPGHFRRVQNWIGSPGSTLETARFVPPAVPDMMAGLYNWERYLHEDDGDVLVQLALVHAQFEILHPFIDGNGRVGRLLIPLFLFHKEVVYEPNFYMSPYFENNRTQYYDALRDITEQGDWGQWVAFFLEGIIKQAELNTEQANQILALYDEMKLEISERTKSQWSIACLDFIFSRPIFNSTAFRNDSGVPVASASRLLSALSEKDGVLKCIEPGSGRRPSIYAFPALLRIINR